MGENRFTKLLKKLFREEDVLWNNEILSNLLVSFCMMMCAVLLVIVFILDIVGVFRLDTKALLPIVGWGLVELLVPCVICRIFKGSKKWLKYVMMIEYVIVLARIDSVLTFNAPFLMVIPVILSCRYFSEKFSSQIAGLTTAVFALSAFCSAYFGMGMTDLNYVEPGAGKSVIIENKLLPAIENLGIDRAAYTKDYMMLNFLPKFLMFSVIAIVCVRIAKTGRNMVLLQADISTKNARIESELTLATDIQANMLPSIFPAFPERPEIDIYATMNPAKEVGGDFYDFFMVDESHIAMVMADVSGKGVPAALFMVIAKTLIKDHTQPGRDLGDVFSEVNKMLCESNSEGMFVTAFEGILDLCTGEFRFVNAGHEMPFICRADGRYEPYKIRPGFVLAGLEEMKYKSGSVMLSPGDKVFQYTDGVTEATNADKELYGMERLEKFLSGCSGLSPDQLLAAVKKDVDAFVGDASQFDDITMLCLEYKEKMDN